MRRAILAAGAGGLIAGEIPHAETEEARRVRESTGRFSERVQAARELSGEDRGIAGGGITAFQRRAYKGPVSEALAQGVDPTYGIPRATPGDIAPVLSDSLTGIVHDNNTPRLEQIIRDYEEAEEDAIPPRDKRSRWHTVAEFKASWDAWRMYLGVPQQFSTFEISSYKPENGSQDIYYYKLSREVLKDIMVNMYDDNEEGFSVETQVVRQFLWDVEVDFNLLSDRDAARDLDNDPNRAYQENLTLGIFLVSKGQDERGHYVSYYDRWDFTPTGNLQAIGQPFEIYDRIYYDPETKEALNPQP